MERGAVGPEDEGAVISTAVGIKQKVEQLTSRLQSCVDNLELVSGSPTLAGERSHGEQQHQRHTQQQQTAQQQRGSEILARMRQSATGAQPLPAQGSSRRTSYTSEEPFRREISGSGALSAGRPRASASSAGLAGDDTDDSDEEDWASKPTGDADDDEDDDMADDDEQPRGRDGAPAFLQQRPVPAGGGRLSGGGSDAPAPAISVGSALKNLKASLSQQVQTSLTGKHVPTHGEQLKNQYQKAVGDSVQRRLLGRADNFHTGTSLDGNESDGTTTSGGGGNLSGTFQKARLAARTSDNGGSVPSSPLSGPGPAPSSRAAALLGGGSGSGAPLSASGASGGSGNSRPQPMRESVSGSAGIGSLRGGGDDAGGGASSGVSSRRTSVDMARPPPAPSKPSTPSHSPLSVAVPATGFTPPPGLMSPAPASPLPPLVPATGFMPPPSPGTSGAGVALASSSSLYQPSGRHDTADSSAPRQSASGGVVVSGDGGSGIGWRFSADLSGGMMSVSHGDADEDAAGGQQGESDLSPFASNRSLQSSTSFTTAFDHALEGCMPPGGADGGSSAAGALGFMPPASVMGGGASSGTPSDSQLPVVGFMPPGMMGVGFTPPPEALGGPGVSGGGGGRRSSGSGQAVEPHYPGVGLSTPVQAAAEHHYPAVGLSPAGLQPPPPRAFNTYQSMQPARPAATMPLRTVETVRLRVDAGAMQQLPPGFAISPALMGGNFGGFGGGGFGGGFGGGPKPAAAGGSSGYPPVGGSGDDSPESNSPMMGLQRSGSGRRRRSSGSDISATTPVTAPSAVQAPIIPTGGFSFGINSQVFSSSQGGSDLGGSGGEHPHQPQHPQQPQQPQAQPQAQAQPQQQPLVPTTSGGSASGVRHASLRNLQTVQEDEDGGEEAAPRPPMGWRIGAASEAETSAYAIDVTEQPPPPPLQQPSQVSALGWQPPPVGDLRHAPLNAVSTEQGGEGPGPGLGLSAAPPELKEPEDALAGGSSEVGPPSDRGQQVGVLEKMPWDDSSDDEQEPTPVPSLPSPIPGQAAAPAPLARQSSSFRRLPPPMLAVSFSLSGMAPMASPPAPTLPSPPAAGTAVAPGPSSSPAPPPLVPPEDDLGHVPSFSEYSRAHSARASATAAPPSTPSGGVGSGAAGAATGPGPASGPPTRQTSSRSGFAALSASSVVPHPSGDVSIVITDADIARSGGMVPALLEIVRERFRAKGFANLSHFAANLREPGSSPHGGAHGSSSHGASPHGVDGHGHAGPQSAALAGETLAERILARVDTFHTRRGVSSEALASALQSVEPEDGVPRGGSEDGSPDTRPPLFKRASTLSMRTDRSSSSASTSSATLQAHALQAQQQKAAASSSSASTSSATLQAHALQAQQQKAAASAMAAAAAAAAAGGAKAAGHAASFLMGGASRSSSGSSNLAVGAAQALRADVNRTSGQVPSDHVASPAATAATTPPSRASRGAPPHLAVALSPPPSATAVAATATTPSTSSPRMPRSASSPGSAIGASASPPTSAPTSTAKAEMSTQTPPLPPPPAPDGLPDGAAALGTALDYFISTTVPLSGTPRSRAANGNDEDKVLPADMPSVRTAADYFKGTASRATINTSTMAAPHRDLPAGVSPAAAAAAAAAASSRARHLANSSTATTPARPQHRVSATGRAGGVLLPRSGSSGRRISAAGRVVIDDEPVDLATYSSSRAASYRRPSAIASPAATSALRTSAHGGVGAGGLGGVGEGGGGGGGGGGNSLLGGQSASALHGPSSVASVSAAAAAVSQVQYSPYAQMHMPVGHDGRALTREMLVHLAHMAPARHPFETTTDEEREEEARRARRRARRTRSPSRRSTGVDDGDASAVPPQRMSYGGAAAAAARPAPAVGVASVPPVPWPRAAAVAAPAGLTLDPRPDALQLHARAEVEAGVSGVGGGGRTRLPRQLAAVMAEAEADEGMAAGLGAGEAGVAASGSPAIAAAPGDTIPVPPLSLDAPDMPEPCGGDAGSTAGVSGGGGRGTLLSGGGASGSLTQLPHETFFIQSPRWRAEEEHVASTAGAGAGGGRRGIQDMRHSGGGGGVSMLAPVSRLGQVASRPGRSGADVGDGHDGVVVQSAMARPSNTLTNTTSWASSSGNEGGQAQVRGGDAGGSGHGGAAGGAVAHVQVPKGAGQQPVSRIAVSSRRGGSAKAAAGRRRAPYWADEDELENYAPHHAPYESDPYDPDVDTEALDLDADPSTLSVSRGGAASPRDSSTAASVLSQQRYVAAARAHRSVSEANSAKRISAGLLLEDDDEDEEDEEVVVAAVAVVVGDDRAAQRGGGRQGREVAAQGGAASTQPQQKRGAGGVRQEWAGVAVAMDKDEAAAVASTGAVASSLEDEAAGEALSRAARVPRDSAGSEAVTPNGTRLRHSLQRLLDLRAAGPAPLVVATPPVRTRTSDPSASGGGRGGNARQASPPRPSAKSPAAGTAAGRAEAGAAAAQLGRAVAPAPGSDGRGPSRSPSVTATAGGTTEADAREREALLLRRDRGASAGAATSAVQRALQLSRLSEGPGSLDDYGGGGDGWGEDGDGSGTSGDLPPEDPYELRSPKYTQDMAEEEYGWDAATGDADVDNIASPRGRRPRASTGTPRGGGAGGGRRGGRGGAAATVRAPLPYDLAEVPTVGVYDASPSYTRQLEQDELQDVVAELVGGAGGGYPAAAPSEGGQEAAAPGVGLQAEAEPSFSLSAAPVSGSRFVSAPGSSAPGSAAAAVAAALSSHADSPIFAGNHTRHTMGGPPPTAAAAPLPSAESLAQAALTSTSFNNALTDLLAGLGPVALTSRPSATTEAAAAASPTRPIATQTSVASPSSAMATQTSLVPADSQQALLLQQLQALEEQARRAAQVTTTSLTGAGQPGAASASRRASQQSTTADPMAAAVAVAAAVVADETAEEPSDPDPELRRLLLAAWSRWYLRRSAGGSAGGESGQDGEGAGDGGDEEYAEAAAAAAAAQAHLQALAAAQSQSGWSEAWGGGASSSPAMQEAANFSHLHMSFTRWLGQTRAGRHAHGAAAPVGSNRGLRMGPTAPPAPAPEPASRPASIPGMATGSNANIAPPYPTSPPPAAAAAAPRVQRAAAPHSSPHPHPNQAATTMRAYASAGGAALARYGPQQPVTATGGGAAPVSTSWPAALRTVSSPPPASLAYMGLAAGPRPSGTALFSSPHAAASPAPPAPMASSTGGGGGVGGYTAAVAPHANTPTVSRPSGVRQVATAPLTQQPPQLQPQPLPYHTTPYQSAPHVRISPLPQPQGGRLPASPRATSLHLAPDGSQAAAAASRRGGYASLGLLGASSPGLAPSPGMVGTAGWGPAGGSTGGSSDLESLVAQHLLASLGSGTGSDGVIVAGVQLATGGAFLPGGSASGASAAARGPVLGGSAGGPPQLQTHPAQHAGAGGGILVGRSLLAPPQSPQPAGLSYGAHRPASPVGMRSAAAVGRPPSPAGGADNIRAPAPAVGSLNLSYYGVSKP